MISSSRRTCCLHFGWSWLWRSGCSCVLSKYTFVQGNPVWLTIQLFLTFSKGIGKIFLEHYYICIGTFVVAISLFGLLFVVDGLRSHRIASLLLTVIIVSARPVHCIPRTGHIIPTPSRLSYRSYRCSPSSRTPTGAT